MDKSGIFKAAHKLAKSVIQAGDNYIAVFAQCLKHVYSSIKNSIAHLNDILNSNAEYVELNSKLESAAVSADSFKKSQNEGAEGFNPYISKISEINKEIVKVRKSILVSEFEKVRKLWNEWAVKQKGQIGFKVVNEHARSIGLNGYSEMGALKDAAIKAGVISK